MKLLRQWFNSYLLLLLLAGMTACSTPESKERQQTTKLRLHREVPSDGTELNRPVPVLRGNSVMVNVEVRPFLTEQRLESAAIVDWMDGFYIQLKFIRQGEMILEDETARNPGKRIVVAVEWDEVERWLGAPLPSKRITNGTLTFTPDCTREEAVRIVRGLNNVAIKENNQPEPKRPKTKPASSSSSKTNTAGIGGTP